MTIKGKKVIITLSSDDEIYDKGRYFMKYCQKCGKEMVDDAIICVHCGCSVQSNAASVQPANNDAPDTMMTLLGFFVPLAGLIIYLVNMDTKPLMARSAGKGALIGVITSTVLSIVFVIIYFCLIGSILGTMVY